MATDTNLCAECQLIAQCGHIILQQVHQALEERVVLTLHVSVPENTTEKHTNDLHESKTKALWYNI